ncbi:putative pectin methyltransferase QUA3 isoform X1 [Primulina tabacum]|uniref:putative pectin methyltransferase QUA3 isoform X1 n=1 Tax=Primulina tabacum TaxID=48773 RepID=UPI003F59BEB4
MGHPNLLSSKQRNVRQWRLRNIISAAFFGAAFLFYLVVFTPLGGSLAAPRDQKLLPSSDSDPRQRAKLAAQVELGRQAVKIDSCPAEMVDHVPCEDPRLNSKLSREMNFYRERHCPPVEETLLCLIPPPRGYRVSVQWPESLHKIWHDNMPYDKIADRKGHQGWMKKEGPYFIFPGGGTMFPDGAVQYIEKLKKYIPIASGDLRTALDMGCGVASFGGYMLNENMLTLSFAPRDSHKAQIQFALERGVPAFIAMLGTHRLPFPGFSFDLVHCSRCLIPFTAYDAAYFLEVDRLLRPGGNLVISGPPVRWSKEEKEWADLQAVARSLCYELIIVNGNTAIWKKPTDSLCPLNKNKFGINICNVSDNPNLAWYFKLKKCVSRISLSNGDYSIGMIPKWPERLTKAPSRANVVKNGINLFEADSQKWEKRVNHYKNSLNLKLGTPSIRNVMDMNAFFGGFAAAIISDPVWVMNVVPAHKPTTLDVIYDRGLIGIYHDWCEPFSTYPRTYDLIHVTDIESLTKDPSSGKDRCNLVDLMVEMDRILRPEGTVIIRDSPETIDKVDRISRAVRWRVSIHEEQSESPRKEKILVATKKLWKL